jgi:hypothetical protein
MLLATTLHSVEWLDERRIGKGLERSDCVLTEALTRKSLRTTTKHFSQDNWCPDRESNRGCLDFELRALAHIHPLQSAHGKRGVVHVVN